MIPLKDMNSFIWEVITAKVCEIIIVQFPQLDFSKLQLRRGSRLRLY